MLFVEANVVEGSKQFTMTGHVGQVMQESMQAALAWLLQRSPNVLLIPGTSSVQHLRENLQAAALTLPADALGILNALAAESKRKPTNEHEPTN